MHVRPTRSHSSARVGRDFRRMLAAQLRFLFMRVCSLLRPPLPRGIVIRIWASPAAAEALPAHGAGSRGCASKWRTCLAWNRPAHRPRRRNPAASWHICSSIVRGQPERLLVGRIRDHQKRHLDARRLGSRFARAKARLAALRLPSFESGAARARPRDLPLRLCRRVRATRSSDPGCIVHAGVRIANSARNGWGIVRIVKSARFAVGNLMPEKRRWRRGRPAAGEPNTRNR